MVANMSGLGLSGAQLAADSTLFYKLVDNILGNWSALRLAIDHGMGGQDGEAKGRWLVGAVEQYFEENKNLEVDEIEDFLEGFLESEFDSTADDGSTKDIAYNFFKFYRLFREDKHDELLKILHSLPVTSVAHVEYRPIPEAPPAAPQKVSNGEGKGNHTAMEVDDDGWHTVTKDNRRH